MAIDIRRQASGEPREYNYLVNIGGSIELCFYLIYSSRGLYFVRVLGH